MPNKVLNIHGGMLNIDAQTIFAFNLRRFIFVAVFLALPATSAWGICVPDTFRVTNVRGVVKAHLEGTDEAVAGAVVKVFTDDKTRKLVAQSKTTVDGSFGFGKLKSGKYRLVVSYPKLWDFELDLVVKKYRKLNDETLIIWLGADFLRPCAGSYAELSGKPTNNE